MKKLNNKKHAEKNKNKTAFALIKAKEIIMPIQKKGIKKGNRFIGFCGVSRCIFSGSLKETCVIARFERSSNRGNLRKSQSDLLTPLGVLTALQKVLSVTFIV